MAELGTGYIIGIDIESLKGVSMSDLDFSFRFYVFPSRYIDLHKSELVCIEMEARRLYFALVDSNLVGRGELIAKCTIQDNEPMWKGGKRTIVLRKSTGLEIGKSGCSCLPSYNRHCKCDDEEYDEGFRINFNHVYSIPKPDVAYIFYGSIVDQIQNYGEITEDMLVSPENHIVSVRAGKIGKTPIPNLSAGQKVVVAIPEDYSFNAKKDNGFGGKVEFDTSIMGANGGESVIIGGVKYRLYGEMMLVNGELFIYVE